MGSMVRHRMSCSVVVCSCHGNAGETGRFNKGLKNSKTQPGRTTHILLILQWWWDFFCCSDSWGRWSPRTSLLTLGDWIRYPLTALLLGKVAVHVAKSWSGNTWKVKESMRPTWGRIFCQILIQPGEGWSPWLPNCVVLLRPRWPQQRIFDKHEITWVSKRGTHCGIPAAAMNISESLRSKPLENTEDYNILQLLELCHHSSTSSNIIQYPHQSMLYGMCTSNIWHWHHAITSRWSKTRDWSCLAMGGMSKSVKSGWTFNGSWFLRFILLFFLNVWIEHWLFDLLVCSQEVLFFLFSDHWMFHFSNMCFLWVYGIRCRRY